MKDWAAKVHRFLNFPTARDSRVRFGYWCQAAILTVVLVAGVLKITDLAAFRASLDTWQFIPRALRDFVALIVPVSEIGIALFWFLGTKKQTMAAVAFVLLVTFATAYLAHVIFLEPPTCECFGKIFAFHQEQSRTWTVVARNTVLMTVLAIGIGLVAWQPRSVFAESRAEHRRTGGFTIIELLMCIAIMAVLIALTVPNLAYFRNNARRTSLASRLSQHATVFASYTSDYKDFFPWFTDPNATYSLVRAPGLTIKCRYFDADSTWHVALSERYYGNSWTNPAFWDLSQKTPSALTDFRYSSAFLADPAFWTLETRTGPAQWRATRSAEVQFPSKKALHTSLGSMGELDASNWKSAVMSFVDGSAAAVSAQDLLPGYPKGNGDWPGSSLNVSLPGLMTMDGVRGRDRR